MLRGHFALAAIFLLAWTAALGYLFDRETALEEGRLRDIALSQAQALFNQLTDIRAWNTSHGGVYVPVTAKTPPNPWLEVPNRDVTTLSGQRLTLMNHAYMTRQLAEITREHLGISLHLTSLNPLRPGNAPEPWERTALDSFERGAPEHAAFARDAEGREIFRYMAPLFTEESCLPCHAKQGYRLGQVRGGLSIVSSTAALASSRRAFRGNLILASLGLWLLGGGLVAAVTTAYHQKSRMVARLGELALEDELTGLNNRRGFLMLVEKQLQIALRTGRPDVLLFIDLDGMKLINDRLGHEAGDAALRRTAAVLHATFRASDIIARFGGDEFVVLCPNTDQDAVAALLESLEQHVADANAGASAPWRLSLSVGASAFDPNRPVTLEEFIRQADAAMYATKQGKRAASPAL